MSLHPGEKGVCSIHGEYDEFCGPCSETRNSESTRTPQYVLDQNRLRSNPKDGILESRPGCFGTTDRHGRLPDVDPILYPPVDHVPVPKPPLGAPKISCTPDLLTFDEYQKLTDATAIYPEHSPTERFSGSLTAVSYCALGLAGEAGEIANKVKKLLRDGDDPTKRGRIADEVGDCLWYAAQLLRELGSFSMGVTGQNNIDKLFDRRARGTLHGSGDNR